MRCLPLSDADEAAITTDAASAQLHAVPEVTVTFQSMSRILHHYRKSKNTVVGFRPANAAAAAAPLFDRWVSAKLRGGRVSLIGFSP